MTIPAYQETVEVHASAPVTSHSSIVMGKTRLTVAQILARETQKTESPIDQEMPAAHTARPAPLQAKKKAAAEAHLFGSWGGIRPALERTGVTPIAKLVVYGAYNADGGTRKSAQQSSQTSLGFNLDMGKIAAIDGGTISVLFINRSGEDINTNNKLRLLQGPLGNYGGGEVWRLSDLWYRQIFGRLDIKIGRLTINEDFATGTCEFQSIYFCGTVTGHTASYWFNGPASNWGGRMRVLDRYGYTQFGVSQDNPRDRSTHPQIYLGLGGGAGTRLMAEREVTVRIHGEDALAGTYKAGIIYDTARAKDLVRDVDGNFALVTNQPLADRVGQWGAWLMGQQQIIAPRADGRYGFSMFFNAVQADRHTAKTRNVFTIAGIMTGPLASRPNDTLGLALGRTLVNPRLRAAEVAEQKIDPSVSRPQRAEYATELTYTYKAGPGFSIKPNVQYYLHPSGVSQNSPVLIIGLGLLFNF